MYLEKLLTLVFKKLDLTNYIQKFREDVKKSFLEARRVPDPELGINALKNEIRASYRQAQDTYLSDIGFLLGLAIYILSNSSVSWSIPYGDTIGILVAVLSLFRAAIVGVMAYENANRIDSPTELHFMKAWNSGVAMKPFKPFLIPIISITPILSREGYDMGMDILQKLLEDGLL